MRLNSLYTLRDQFRQLKQVLSPRDGPTPRLLHERIPRAHIGPPRRKEGRPPGFGKIVNPPLSPLWPLLQKFKTPAPPGMKRVNYGEISRALPRTGCSPRATPKEGCRPRQLQAMDLDDVLS